ncbi:SMI1/KNR4 family protein [Streptomyces niveiscabiei]|uniref:SMI1/KNR4 family protein n=1 Tax=Streptomyces niveiscabiei TaxID=164115 RepID=UPI0029B99E56|nr:SMI1/KNR4 family protein [Streptomyces niveiscabiei]MDX3383849.1 SMI1/KNR4 family protein [Streptomyces niveiscabiei]
MLPPPAPEAEIQAVERELDLVFPPGLRAFYRLRDGTGHPADFGWAPEPGTGLPPRGQGTAWLLPMKCAIPPVRHLPLWSEGPHTIGRPADPALRYLAFAATDRGGLYGLFADCTPGPGQGRIGTFEEAADALYENRPVEDATGHRDTAVPTPMNQGPAPRSAPPRSAFRVTPPRALHAPRPQGRYV